MVVPWRVIFIAFLLDALHFDVLVGSWRSVGVGLVLGNRLLGCSDFLLRWPDDFLLGCPDFLFRGSDLAIVAALDMDHLGPGDIGRKFLILGGFALKQQKIVGIGCGLGLLQLVVLDQFVGIRLGVLVGDNPVDDLMGILVGLLVVADYPVDDLVGLLLAGGPTSVVVVVAVALVVVVVVVIDIVEIPDFLVLKHIPVELSPDVILVLLPEQIEVSLVELVGVVGIVHFDQSYFVDSVVLNIVVFSVEVDSVLQTVQ